jgi:hypothetical protein
MVSFSASGRETFYLMRVRDLRKNFRLSPSSFWPGPCVGYRYLGDRLGLIFPACHIGRIIKPRAIIDNGASDFKRKYCANFSLELAASAFNYLLPIALHSVASTTSLFCISLTAADFSSRLSLKIQTFQLDESSPKEYKQHCADLVNNVPPNAGPEKGFKAKKGAK